MNLPESSFTYECTHTNPHTVIPQTMHIYLFSLLFSHFLIYCSTLHCSNHHTGPSEQKIYCFTCWQQYRVLIPLTLFWRHLPSMLQPSFINQWHQAGVFQIILDCPIDANWKQPILTVVDCMTCIFAITWTTYHMRMWVSSDNLTLYNKMFY